VSRVYFCSIIHDVKEKDDFYSLAECGLGSINVGIVSQEIKRGLSLWMMHGCHQFKNSLLPPNFFSLLNCI